MAVDALKKVADDDATAKKTTASQEVDARTKLKDATDKAVTNAQNDVNETTALLAAKNLERARLAKNTVVATHIWELAKDKFDKLTSVKDLLNRKQ